MYQRIEAWRNRKIAGVYPYVYLDGISLKRTWGGEVRNVSILVAVGGRGRSVRRRELMGRLCV